MKRAALLSALVILVSVTGGCGEGGSNPVLYPEVRVQVEPLTGTATFQIAKLTGGQIEYTSLATTTFTATSIFNFSLENAAPPYSAQVVQQGDGAIRVRLVVIGGGPTATVIGVSRGPGCGVDPKPTGCTVTLQTGTLPTLGPPNPEVRFEVCSQVPGQYSCFLTNPPQPPDPQNQTGLFGIPFGGNLGDVDNTFQIGQEASVDPATTTPMIYFLQNANEAVSGVFQSSNGNELVARLYINSGLQYVAAGTSDVVVKKDL